MNADVKQLQELVRAPLGHNGAGEKPPLGDLIETLEAYFLKYIDFPDKHLATLCAFWIVQTYCYECFYYCGYLALRSATPGCGKTRLLSLISLFAKGRPDIMANPTAAVLFRLGQQVMILDEIDKLRNVDKDTHGDILAVLDSGFQCNGTVYRCVGKNHEVKKFPVYCPKAIAGIELLADTLADRCFSIQMRRSDRSMPRLKVRKLEHEASLIRQQLEEWAAQNTDLVLESYEGLSEVAALAGYDHRFQDLCEPLLILSHIADEERGDMHERGITHRLLAGIKAAAVRRQPTGREEQLHAFLDIAEEHLSGVSEVFVRTASLIESCADRDEVSWIETGRKLANFLKSFEISSVHRPDRGGRGYYLTQEWVLDWRNRYSRPEEEGHIPPVHAYPGE